MAEKSKDFKEKSKNKKKIAGKTDFESIYDEISEGNALLKANESFWTRKGNSKKYTCVLCNIGIQVQTNLHAFKSSVLAHVEDKFHRKRYDSFVAGNTSSSSSETPKSEGICCNPPADQPNNNDHTVITADTLKQVEEALININKSLRDVEIEDVNLEFLKFLDSIFKSLHHIKSKEVVIKSKPLIEINNSGDFYCSQCEVLVFNSLNSAELRYNLFVHLNQESHTKKPIFSEIIKNDFHANMTCLFKLLPASFKDEFNNFQVGPVPLFVKCIRCDQVVSTNVHRFEKHLRSKFHVGNRKWAAKGEPRPTEPRSHRIKYVFNKLIAELGSEFEEDEKFILVGELPGYVVCFLCSSVVIPSKFYMESHFRKPFHIANKKAHLTNNFKFKIRLADIMGALPKELRSTNIFKESVCGLKCKLCNTVVAPTSYSLYTHIIQEIRQLQTLTTCT